MIDVQKTYAQGYKDLLAAGAVQAHDLAGSARYLANPKDVDIIVLVSDPWYTWARGLEAQGYKRTNDYEGDAAVDETWGSMRKGDVNVIVMHDAARYQRQLAAARVCEALQLEKKFDRIVINKIIRDGLEVEQARAEAQTWVEKHAADALS